MATLSGVAKGYEDLADYAATLSQPQLRALKFRLDPHTRQVRSPERTTFERVLTAVDAEHPAGRAARIAGRARA